MGLVRRVGVKFEREAFDRFGAAIKETAGPLDSLLGLLDAEASLSDLAAAAQAAKVALDKLLETAQGLREAIVVDRIQDPAVPPVGQVRRIGVEYASPSVRADFKSLLVDALTDPEIRMQVNAAVWFLDPAAEADKIEEHMARMHEGLGARQLQ